MSVVDPWLVLLLDEPLFYKVLGVLSHVTLVIAIFVALFNGFHGAAVLLFFVDFQSLGYHICASFGKCAGFPVETWQVGDYLTVTALALVMLNLAMMPRDPEHALAALSRKEIYLRRLPPQQHASHRALEIAPRQFATSDDVPLIHVFSFYDGMTIWQHMSLLTVRNFYPLQFYGMVATLLLSILPVIVYVFLYRREVIRITMRGERVVLASHTFEPWYLTGTVIFGSLGIGCFCVPGVDNSGWHSAWHFLAGLALICFMLAIKMAPRDHDLVALIQEEEEEEGKTRTRDIIGV